MESLFENRPLFYCLLFSTIATFFFAFEMNEEINQQFQLVSFPILVIFYIYIY